MTDRLGRADLHIHTRASDGIDPIATILGFVEASTDLDVVAITDHERIDAALAAQTMARDLGHRAEIVVGEEVSTLGGHLLGLFLTERVRPLRSLRTTIGEIHEQGGLAIPAHPLVPYPLCAQGWVLRRLLASRDPRVRPDALETFNPTMLGRPWHGRVVAFAAAHALPAVGNSDAHQAVAIGTGWTAFPGRTAEDLRAAILEGTTHQHGSFHGTGRQVRTFGRQLQKYRDDARAAIRASVRRDGSGRDLGYPGGQRRPPRFDDAWRDERTRSGSATDQRER
ncbi:MAG TPA: PHP-associated domain-containing protein [Candidatus Limnocylindrales bacterium]|nr:PHP-associated domain-containing protein [Candidatus Limnocylindrales bacterium]